MSKRKPAKMSKRASSVKISKAKRAAQAIVKGPKESRLPLVPASSTETPPKHPNDSTQEAPVSDPRQPASPVENPATAIQEDSKPMTTGNDSKKEFDFSSAYQAKLQEVAQADINLAFESAKRLATISSPVEFPRIIAEFTSKRIAMYMEIFKRNG
jgi:hypothetical protein